MLTADWVIFRNHEIGELRKLAVGWMDGECGAPAIHPQTKLPAFVMSGADNEAWKRFHLLRCFMQLGDLDPGRYEFDNPHLSLHDGGQWFDLPKGYRDADDSLKPRIEIDVTAEHIKLIRSLKYDEDANSRYPHFGTKRPYNLHSWTHHAVREALGMEEDAGDDEDLHRLHREVAPALQAFFLFARFETGVYVGHPIFRTWSRHEDLPPEITEPPTDEEIDQLMEERRKRRAAEKAAEASAPSRVNGG